MSHNCNSHASEHTHKHHSHFCDSFGSCPLVLVLNDNFQCWPFKIRLSFVRMNDCGVIGREHIIICYMNVTDQSVRFRSESIAILAFAMLDCLNVSVFPWVVEFGHFGRIWLQQLIFVWPAHHRLTFQICENKKLYIKDISN